MAKWLTTIGTSFCSTKMAIFIILSTICLLGIVHPSSATYPAYQGASSYSVQHSPYSFSWSVNDAQSGNEYGHREARAYGSNDSPSKSYSTEGEYYVKLPDGRVQTVTYYVDPYSGYQAKVVYKGKATPYKYQAYSPYRAPTHTNTVYNPVAAQSVPTEYTKAVAPITNAPSNYGVASSQPSYRPTNYQPAPISYPHHEWHNTIIPEREKYHTHHHKHPQHVRILATPPPKVKTESHDPYLATEEELKGRDFSGPMFYINTKKIIPRKKNDGKPEKHHAKSLKHSHHNLLV